MYVKVVVDENGDKQVLDGPTVHLPDGRVLTPDNHGDHDYPVDGWVWAETAEVQTTVVVVPPEKLAAVKTGLDASRSVIDPLSASSVTKRALGPALDALAGLADTLTATAAPVAPVEPDPGP